MYIAFIVGYRSDRSFFVQYIRVQPPSSNLDLKTGSGSCTGHDTGVQTFKVSRVVLCQCAMYREDIDVGTVRDDADSLELRDSIHSSRGDTWQLERIYSWLSISTPTIINYIQLLDLTQVTVQAKLEILFKNLFRRIQFGIIYTKAVRPVPQCEFSNNKEYLQRINE